MKNQLITGSVAATVLGAALLIARACNVHYNDRQIKTPSYQMVSIPKGIGGHIEFTRYANGSQDVKIYPSFGHRISGSELDEDINGDGKVDRIRKQGSEFTMHASELLIRSDDYDTRREDFDEADSRLKELIEKYPR